MIAAGRLSGLQVGDRMAVYRGNRLFSGAIGNFVLPGAKIAEVEIKKVDETRSRALAPADGSVQPGDIAMPVESAP